MRHEWVTHHRPDSRPVPRWAGLGPQNSGPDRGMTCESLARPREGGPPPSSSSSRYPPVPRTVLCPPGTTWHPASAILAFVAKVTEEGSPDFVPAPGPHRGLRQRRHALVRTAHVRPGRVHRRPHPGAWPRAPRMEDSTALQGPARRRPRALAGWARRGWSSS